MEAFCSSIFSARVSRRAPSGRIRATCDLTSSTEAPGDTSMEMSLTWSSGAASGMNQSASMPTMVAPAMVVPKLNSPTTVTSTGWPWTTTWVVSPMLRPERPRAPDSRAISLPPWGWDPWTQVIPGSWG